MDIEGVDISGNEDNEIVNYNARISDAAHQGKHGFEARSEKGTASRNMVPLNRVYLQIEMVAEQMTQHGTGMY